MNDLLDRALAAAPTGCQPLAVLPFGSDLYGTQLTFHDHDLIVVTADGRPRQIIDGDLDVRIAPLRHLLAHAAHGSLVETEVLFALTAGHGEVFDSAWAPLLRAARGSLPKYAATTNRLARTPQPRPKDRVRWDLFLDRAWSTGNTDPRFSGTEREEFLARLAREQLPDGPAPRR